LNKDIHAIGGTKYFKVEALFFVWQINKCFPVIPETVS